MDEFKQRQREMWGAGDYATLAEPLVGAAQLIVERTGVGSGARVLDVACGPGTATLPAARTGAEVTGLDLSPALIEAGRRKAGEEGLEVAWVEGDAEALPFDDETFHHVISNFGHMFAPRHRETASEMARVCADDGVIGMCCWTPEGLVGRLFGLSAQYFPPPPPYASPPVLWGTEDHVREMFDGRAKDVSFERQHVVWEGDSFDEYVDRFTSRFPTMVVAQSILGDRWQDLRAELVELWDDANEADGDGVYLEGEYLVSIVRF